MWKRFDIHALDKHLCDMTVVSDFLNAASCKGYACHCRDALFTGVSHAAECELAKVVNRAVVMIK